MKNGEICQPNNSVEIRIPLPLGYDPSKIKLLHENETGFEELDFEVIDNNIVFETNHFSLFKIVSTEIKKFVINGSIDSINGKEITLRLIEGSKEVKKIATANNEYCFEDVEKGVYILEVCSDDCVTREYEIIVDDESIVCDVQINLIGDIDGNGKVNISDYNAILRHVKKTSALDGYAFDCADIDGNGKIMVTDYNAVLRHVKKTEMLW